MQYIRQIVWIIMHAKSTQDIRKLWIKEHLSNLKHHIQKHSVLTNYVYLNNHYIEWVNIKILYEDKKYYSRLMSETFHIR